MNPYLIKSIRQLEKANSDFIVLPCNTLHNLLPYLRNQTKLEILDLTEETAKEIKLKKYRKIGILSTSKTKNSKLYNKLISKTKIIYPNENEQKIISKIIIKIIAQKSSNKDKEYLKKIIMKMRNQGAEKILLACTDLANLIEKDSHILDTQKILIKSIKNKMRNN